MFSVFTFSESKDDIKFIRYCDRYIRPLSGEGMDKISGLLKNGKTAWSYESGAKHFIVFVPDEDFNNFLKANFDLNKGKKMKYRLTGVENGTENLTEIGLFNTRDEAMEAMEKFHAKMRHTLHGKLFDYENQYYSFPHMKYRIEEDGKFPN